MTVTDAYWKHRRTPAHTAFRRARDFLLTHRTDHARAYRDFRWPRPAHFNWALEWFDVVAADNLTPALVLTHPDGSTQSVSYSAMAAASDRTATWLRDAGVRRGDRILIALGQQCELWECLLACLKLGAVAVPVYPTLTGVEAADRIRRGRVRHVICRNDLTPRMSAPIPGLRIAVPGGPAGWAPYTQTRNCPDRFVPDAPTPASDLAFCYFTSGTTAVPKLLAHTHSSYPIGHLSSLYWNGLLPGDRHLNISAPGWAKHSWSSLFVPWNAEATVLVPPPEPLDHAAVPALLRDRHATSICAPASTWRALRPHLHRARPALREATSAGEPLADRIIREVAAAWGVTVREGYGQSETTAMAGTTPGMPRTPGFLGRPLPGYAITLRTPQGRPAAAIGEICLAVTEEAPVGLMAGYLDEHGKLNRATADGLYRTGDLGERDHDGRLRILGRTDDVFKSFDHRISPYAVEAVLKTHPAVAEAAVVPRPHPIGGSVPHAVVELAPGHPDSPDTAASILRHCADRLAPELAPRSVAATPRLPRTASGKVRRSALRESG